jgi:hypothetical protein
MEEAIVQLVRRELSTESWPPLSPNGVNAFPLIVLAMFPWPDLLDSLLEAGLAVEGRRPSFRCRDCYYGMPIPPYRADGPQRGHCVLGCIKSYCGPFSRQARDGADRFFVTHAELFFGDEASPEVLAATTQRVLTMETDCFNDWFEDEMKRALFGQDEAGRAWLLRVHMSLWSR